MSYNFDLYLIDCSAFNELTIELSKCYSSPQEKVTEGGMKLVWEFIKALESQGRAVSARSILPFHRAFDSLGTWSALAEIYTDVLPILPTDERQSYDYIYRPLIGPWIEDGADETRVNDIHDETGYLAKHGIKWVLGPERCVKIARLLRTHSFSRLIHLVFVVTAGHLNLRRRGLFTDDLLDSSNVQEAEVHADISNMCDAWRVLFEQAQARSWGLWVQGGL